MPFIKAEKRKQVESDIRLADEPGDVCNTLYMCLGAALYENRRWKTVHNMYKSMVMNPDWAIEMFKDTKWTRVDVVAALQLAWQVLFVKEIMALEEENIEKNGDIVFTVPVKDEVKA